MSGNPSWGKVRTLVAVLSVGLMVGAVALMAIDATAAEHLAPTGSGDLSDRTPAAPAPASAPNVPDLPPNEVYGIEATVPVGATPVAVAYDPANQDVYVTNSQGDTVSVINGTTEKVVATVNVGANPSGVAYDSVNHVVYVVNSFQNTVSEIASSNNTVVGSFDVSGEPTGIAFDNATGDLYVTQQSSNTTEVYSPTAHGSQPTVIPVGHQPIGVVYDPSNQYIYVGNSNSSNVSVINGTTLAVVTSIPVGTGPLALAYDSGQQEIFVANDKSNTTSVIATSSNSVVATISVRGHPDGAAYNPSLGIVLVTQELTSSASVILDSNNSVVATVAVGVDPIGAAWDSANGYEYVANGNSTNVSVVGTPSVSPYSVSFVQTGLPLTSSWTVTFGTTPKTGTGSTISFTVDNGTYPFSVTPIAGYVTAPLSGSVLVKGFPVVEPITFSLVTYTVTFNETGLAKGTIWSVVLNGTSDQSETSSLSFVEPNGSYQFTVPSISGYSETPASSWANVSGSAVLVTLSFTNLSKSTSTPSVTSSVGGIPLWEIIVIVVVIVGGATAAVIALRHARPPTPPAS